MMRYRLKLLGFSEPETRVKIGSALSIPYPDATFDYVYSIGCLHHVGDLQKSIDEVYRVLSRGGKAIIMLYNRNSLRQWLIKVKSFLKRKHRTAEAVRGLYDKNLKGETTPHTDYVSPRDVRHLMKRFSSVKIDKQNMDPITISGKVIVQRKRLLNNLGRLLGLDLYIVAQKN